MPFIDKFDFVKVIVFWNESGRRPSSAIALPYKFLYCISTHHFISRIVRMFDKNDIVVVTCSISMFKHTQCPIGYQRFH